MERIALIACTDCRLPYPQSETPYRCPQCGGVFDFIAPLKFDPARVRPDLPGMWRYRESFGLEADVPVVTLGEGDTPLVWATAFGRQVAFKLEYLNPTGSFKDRGTTLLVSWLRGRGVLRAVEDSSGNAGASFAAYAARAGVQAQVFVPAYASGPKRAQIAAYGADVVAVPGPRSQASLAVERAAAEGLAYASHAWLPHGLPGFATVAYELVEQLGGAPGTVILPAGQGSLLLGMGRGFEALLTAGQIDHLPQIVGVQAAACAPLAARFDGGPRGQESVQEGATLAEGVRILRPLRAAAVVEIVQATGGRFVTVQEEAILSGRDQLASRGFYVEPTSAIVWDALAQVIETAPQPVVVILTGSGLKTAISM